MTQKGLTGFFEKYLSKEPLFLDKKALQSSYMPKTILHRDEQINQIAKILAPSLRMEKPSNLFIYGKTGTGKTLSVEYITNQINEVAVSKAVPIKIININCKLKKVADTEYRLLAQIIKELGKEIPATGLPTDEVYKAFFSLVDREEKLLILVLDEIDQLVKKTGDGILYNLTRINTNLKKAQISILGISNDLLFVDVLDPRVKSSLSEEEIVFPPYNALQIQHILKARAKKAFKSDALGEGLIEKCAAYAAREHGDARRALDLLRIAGEVAEREGSTRVLIKHLDHAEQKIERDKVSDIISSQPKQFQLTLYATLLVHDKKEKIFTGEIYDIYKDLCAKTNMRPLTQRRISDILGEMDMLGVINAKIISKGRYGRTREISMATTNDSIGLMKAVLKESIGL